MPIKKKALLAIIIVLSLLLTSFSLTSANQTTDNSLYVSKSEKEVFTISQVKVEKQDKFVKINLEESSENIMRAGKPVLPMVVKTFVFPKNTRITSINCRILDFTDERLDMKIIPFSKPLPKLNINTEQVRDIVKMDSAVYQSSEFYPDKWYDYAFTYGVDGVRLSIRFYPVRYSPAANLIRTASDVEIDIKYDSFFKKQIFSEEYDLVIIAPDAFSNLLQPLVDHKKSVGVDTFVKTTEEIYAQYSGRDNPEKIKYFIKDAIESYNVSYVLLVGGIKGITREWYVPVRLTNLYDEWDPGYVSDLYYADIYRLNQTTFEKEFDDWDSNGNNIFAEWDLNSVFPEDVLDCDPDVHVGRLACRSRREVKTVVNKIINYETKKQYSFWSKRMICVAGDTVPPEYDPEDVYEGELVCDIASSSMASAGYDIVKLYASTGAFRGPLSVIRKLTLGADFAYFNGHGNTFSWATHSIDSDDYTWISGLTNKQMNLLFNGKRLPVVVVGGCHNSMISVTPSNFVEGIKNQGLGYFSINASNPSGFWSAEWIRECWSWKFISVRHGGAIATIGNTGVGYGMEGSDISYSDWISIQFFDAVGNQSKTTLGEAHSQSIIDYITTFGVNGEDEKVDRKTVDSLLLLGDPSLKIA